MPEKFELEFVPWLGEPPTRNGTAQDRHDHVAPRPVSHLPEYAKAQARHAATEKLVERFGMPPEAARTIADCVVSPQELRKAAESPDHLAVPGGTLLAVRADLWARKVLPDIGNPRIGPACRHQFAVVPGTGGEESRFAPVAPATSEGESPWLRVEVESREHFSWAVDLSARHVLETNDWRYSIRNQGVLTEVWAAATCYTHTDGTDDLWCMTTAEGSSRITAVHSILEVHSAVAAYDTTDQVMRQRIKGLNTAFDRGPQKKDLEALRCEVVPGLVLVGFIPLSEDVAQFSSAVRSLVALRHVDAPKPWGEGPEMEALADAVLAEMERRGVITAKRRDWLAGSITREDAEAAHLSGDPAVRAAAIVELFTSANDNVRAALRAAVTQQSTRKRITPLLRTKLATALIVRALGGEGENVDRIRRYMQLGFGERVRDSYWKATQRSADELRQSALEELEADGGTRTLGPARLELAARAAYPLIASLSLWGDRGTTNFKPARSPYARAGHRRHGV